MLDHSPIRRALISVSDKTELIALAKDLVSHAIELVSTGGTAVALRAAGFEVRDVTELTHFPEMMDGRVKTLHPAIHGAILARREDENHLAAMQAHNIAPIDLLVVNLYPFEKTIGDHAPYETCIEQIDVGGPTMIRAAAKNHASVTVITDIEDYDALKEELTQHKGKTSYAFRQKMAAIAFGRTAAYDGAISEWFAQSLNDPAPRRRIFSGHLKSKLRYGENPHQPAAFYQAVPARPGITNTRQIQGKSLSYNNINDADAALDLISEFPQAGIPTVAILKHTNPCGVAQGKTPLQAYQRALSADPISAFGGIVVCNAPLDQALSEAITKIFTEVVLAPAADENALKIFATKPNLRLLLMDAPPPPAGQDILPRAVGGGFLVQAHDRASLDETSLNVVTEHRPTPAQLADLRFAWAIVKHVKSNAIVTAKDGQTIGIGAGQMNRVDSTRLATSAKDVRGSVLASDAFFPFADSIETAAKAGVSAIIQPGGAQRDSEVIEAANKAGIAMIFTGMRHFRH